MVDSAAIPMLTPMGSEITRNTTNEINRTADTIVQSPISSFSSATRSSCSNVSSSLGAKQIFELR